ncbi:MAG TPA: PAS domain S-box protein [Syntrophorhabdaceae bacterium]|jgi:PAS domain S-box-containing protein
MRDKDRDKDKNLFVYGPSENCHPKGSSEIEKEPEGGFQTELTKSVTHHALTGQSQKPGEARHRPFIENVRDGIYLLDKEGRFTYVNNLIAERSGFSREWYIGKHFAEIIGSRHRRRAVAKHAAAMRGEMQPPFEFTYFSSSGEEIWVEVSVTPLGEEGSIIGLLGISRDISWRKSTEGELKRHRDSLEQLVAERTAELRKSEKRYRDLVINAPVAIYQTSRAGNIVYANQTCALTFGFNSVEELISAGPFPRHRTSEERKDMLRKLDSPEGVKNCETEFIAKSGEHLNVLLSATLKEGLISGMMIDITERKKAEKELQKERETFFTILENDPSGIALVDGDGRYRYVNPRFTEITGYTLKDVPTGKIWFEKAYPDETYRNAVIRTWKLNRQPDGGSLDVEFRIRCKNAKAKDIEFRTTHLSTGTITVLNDVTSRKEVERALHESERKYRSIFENAMEGIFQTTPRGRFLSVNPALARIYGYDSPQELMKCVTNIGRQMYVHPIDRTRLKDLYKKQGFVEKFETQLYRKDGSTVWISMSSRTVRDPQGRVLHYEGTVENITTRKEKEAVEAQLRQSQKMEALGTLAGGIAHDFNNILVGIIGFTEILLDDTAPESPMHRKLELIFKSARRGHNLVRQILAFSRKGETDRKPVALALLIREATELLRATIPSNIEIRERILLQNDLVLADQVQVHQVLINLCTNAAHAIGSKGGVIEISLTDQQPDPADPAMENGEMKGLYVKLMVNDTGCGIPPETLERVFEPFFTTKKPGEGTGMGLSVVHGIVKAHDGLISVRSRLREGTSFSVYLPRLKTGNPPATAIPSAKPPPPGRILLVDDEEIIAEMTRERLERLGYTVTVVTGGSEALSLFRSDPGAFDLVITDYAMPAMTGADLARQLTKEAKRIPVILCSGANESLSFRKMKKLGISGFLVKPFLKEELARQVRTVLQGAYSMPSVPGRGSLAGTE